MKTVVNGVPSMSTQDGWSIDGVTGWDIETVSKLQDNSDAAMSLYQKVLTRNCAVVLQQYRAAQRNSKIYHRD